jgi:hypothetical protein
MKSAQLCEVLETAACMYREAGNPVASQGLREICTLFDGRKAMSVSAFATLIEQTASSELNPSTPSGIMARLSDLLAKS